MPVDLTNNDISTRYALQEDFDNGFVGRDRQVVIQTDDPKGYRPVIMDGVTQGGKNKVALMDDVEDIYNRYNNYGVLPEDATQKTYSTVQQLQSTTANLSDYAGAQGQIVYNTETKHLHVMDGSTAGGIQVANYSELPIIATEEEAKAGTDNTKMMTPLRTKQAVDILSPKVSYWDIVPIGLPLMWFSNTLPSNKCIFIQGQGLSTSEYPELFAVWGYTFGGSGGTFNAPAVTNRHVLISNSFGTVGAGLPNITGRSGSGRRSSTDGRTNWITTDGAFYSDGKAATYSDTDPYYSKYYQGYMNAARVSGFYGASGTVQVDAFRVRLICRAK